MKCREKDPLFENSHKNINFTRRKVTIEPDIKKHYINTHTHLHVNTCIR